VNRHRVLVELDIVQLFEGHGVAPINLSMIFLETPLSQAVAWLNWLIGRGVEQRQVMSDKGSAYIAKGCSALCLNHIRTKPYTPRTNGKAERLIQTLRNEWA